MRVPPPIPPDDRPAGRDHVRGGRGAVLWPALAVLLLAGVGADRRMFHTPPADVAPYHARVRAAAAAAAPVQVGAWAGEDNPLPPAAVALLNPNVTVSRRFRHAVTGQQVTLLLVHCSDARDVLGHYPPVCYPGAGWTLATAEPRDWAVDDTLVIHGMRYEFTSTRLDRPALTTVSNFMVLPDGTTCRDMDGVTDRARDPGRKFFGAAQVQLVCDQAVGRAECDELVTTFARAHRGLIDTMLSGVPR